MAAEAVVSSMVPVILDTLNTMIMGEGDLEDKTRWLKISIVNTTHDQRLMMEDSWFDSGRFWAQPFDGIAPGQSVSFGVCNKDGSLFTGVSGGVGLRAYDVNSGDVISDGDGDWWICAFSNPFTGSRKCLTRWKDFGIYPIWDEMDTDSIVRDARCGCYREDNNHIVFVWKNPDTPW